MTPSLRSAFLPLFALGAAGLGLVAWQAGTRPVSTEVYSNIEVDSETTDAGGIELELRSGLTSNRVLLVTCEGGCHGAEALDLAFNSDGLVFSWRDPLAKPGERPERFVLRKVARDLVFDQPTWARGQVLKRVPHPAPGRTRDWAAYH